MRTGRRGEVYSTKLRTRFRTKALFIGIDRAVDKSKGEMSTRGCAGRKRVSSLSPACKRGCQRPA